MSLHDEFEALKHVPHELAAWVKSLIHRVDPSDVPSEPVSVPESAQPVAEAAPVAADAAPAPEGAEHA